MNASDLVNAKWYDLSQPFHNGMPHLPQGSEFVYTMVGQHGNKVYPGQISPATDMICSPMHMGTHIDALGHFSQHGCLHGGIPAATAQSGRTGLAVHGIDELGPIIRRGVMLDIPKAAGVEVLEGNTVIGSVLLNRAIERQNVRIGQGDVVFVRTGWIRHWNDRQRYFAPEQPGVDLEGMKSLAAYGIFACGSDTAAFEKIPTNFEVHAFNLVEKGIYIMENVNLESLSADEVSEFTIVVLPLKYQGATASPIRPIALV